MVIKKSPPSIQNIQFNQAIEDRYLAYALSTIMSRSLPDVRDGLKPVHRRLIYAMQQLKLNPQSSFKKCARIVGDVMGKFHPHGDAAIYGALVRLAQEFSVRYPLIEGQGNFGNIDGDGAAAMRYTEARLSDTAILMMQGLEHECVDFTPTYDGETQEPVVFPTLFPNLLANGATGIAVGMATSIPPHNADEIFQALEHLINHPTATVQDLLTYIKGPDFPTGGLLMENEASILKYYETGKGSFRLRAHWFVEEQPNKNYKIIIDQIPYLIEKAKIVEKIASLILERKNTLIDDVQDESTDDIRLVIYPKNRNIKPEVLMESLFSQTDLDIRFPFNMNALDPTGTPKVMNLKEVLSEFLTHCRHIQHREASYRLNIINNRLNILNGFLIVYLNLDEVIRIIREEDDPKLELIKRFSLNEAQVESILNMKLRSLHKLQEIQIKKEITDLSTEKEELNALLRDPNKQTQKLKTDLRTVRKKFNAQTELGRRRTIIAGEAVPVEIPEEPLEIEKITIICSQKNWIKMMKGHEIDTIKYKDGDSERFVVQCTNLDKIVLFSSNGRAYTLDPLKIPRIKNNWESLRLMIEMSDNDTIIAMHALSKAMLNDPAQENALPSLFLIASNKGYGFLISSHQFFAQTKNGKQILTLKENESAAVCRPISDCDTAVIIGTNRKMIAFPIAEIPVLAKGRGVILQKYSSAEISDLQLCLQDEGFKWNRNGKIHITKEITTWLCHRGAIGKLPPPLFPRDNLFHL